MASKANSANAIRWISGDAFRGVANATQPVDDATAAGLFGNAPTNLLIAMVPFGGIRAGFNITPTQNVTREDIWNNDSGGAYDIYRGKTSETIAFEATDIKSKAVVLTMLLGGSIAETDTGSGVWKWTRGDGEEFSILLQLRAANGTDKDSLWIPRCTIAELPSRTLNAEQLASLPINLEPLAPADGSDAVQQFSNYNPLAA
jgi:hypothetical protein